MSDQVTLASAQLAVARAYGFASWPKLKAEVEARTLDLAEKVDAFCKASIGDGSGRAARMLAATPAIAGHSFATAVILGDAARVSEELRRDPGLATRRDPRSGWTPLHAVSASRWHQFEPTRSGGLLAVAQLLIEAGADPTAKTGWRRNSWSPLGCAVASANSGPSNQAIVELLLEHGATPDDRDLYLAGFAHDRHQLLPLLLERVPNLREIAKMALAAPISNDDVEGVRSLLQAGADPGRYARRRRPGDTRRVCRNPAPVAAPRFSSCCSRTAQIRTQPGLTDARPTDSRPPQAGPTWLSCCAATARTTRRTDVDRFLVRLPDRPTAVSRAPTLGRSRTARHG